MAPDSCTADAVAYLQQKNPYRHCDKVSGKNYCFISADAAEAVSFRLGRAIAARKLLAEEVEESSMKKIDPRHELRIKELEEQLHNWPKQSADFSQMVWARRRRRRRTREDANLCDLAAQCPLGDASSRVVDTDKLPQALLTSWQDYR